jgi:hypothetical protein
LDLERKEIGESKVKQLAEALKNNQVEENSFSIASLTLLFSMILSALQH